MTVVVSYHYSHDLQGCLSYSKTCLQQQLKKTKKKVLTKDGSLMKAESIAECSLGAFYNTFDNRS